MFNYVFLASVVASLSAEHVYPGIYESKKYGDEKRKAVQHRTSDKGMFDKNFALEGSGYQGDVHSGLTRIENGEKNLRKSYDGQSGIEGDHVNHNYENKKGFSSAGFQDFHFKDEIGKKSTFYDSSDDTRGLRGYRERHGQYEDVYDRGAYKDVDAVGLDKEDQGREGYYHYNEHEAEKKYRDGLHDKYEGDYQKRYQNVHHPWGYLKGPYSAHYQPLYHKPNHY
uniref:Uncharacterized protein n=1 Tax=Clastoptera arizonana TaxID=38151 RepID=A0A1B6DSI9_9HEMI